MTIRAALNHKTEYRYSRLVELGPQVVRLRPAPHNRTPISSYSLTVYPEKHFLNWQQDPHGNYLARLVFPEKTQELIVEVDLLVEMTVINPFDFFLEPTAEKYPFDYEISLAKDLDPFLHVEWAGPRLLAYLESIDRSSSPMIEFLVGINHQLQRDIGYVLRMEVGVQSCEQTLALGTGSCRDTSWLMVQLLRRLGLATRFVSGYLIQLTSDVKSLDGPSGPERDCSDLHAWVEVYLPGAGWIGLDPTSGMFAGEGHVPLACTPEPISAAPITGSVEPCETEFHISMEVTRIHEDPRVTKPYTEEQWSEIDALGRQLDERLEQNDVRLTMGGKPTFVSSDDMQGVSWKTETLGEEKKQLAGRLLHRLKDRFAPGGMLHFGQSAWYPGELLPRWAYSCYWRTDGNPIWDEPEWFADTAVDYGHTSNDAQEFSFELAARLGVNPERAVPTYEDMWYFLWRERRLPIDLDIHAADLDVEADRAQLARVFERGLKTPVGYLLPLRVQWSRSISCWQSGRWPVRTDQIFLTPGDLPMGLRLPLTSLPFQERMGQYHITFPLQPRVEQSVASDREQLHVPWEPHAAELDVDWEHECLVSQSAPQHVGRGVEYSELRTGPAGVSSTAPSVFSLQDNDNPSDIIRTALCVEPRDGRLHIFFPAVDRLEDYLSLVTAVEETSRVLQRPVVIEGYLPPRDHRIHHCKIIPDRGVVKVNIHPAHNWHDLKTIVDGIYDDARQSRLSAEKFDLDGRHTGTGGGNHIVFGGPTPADSPFLRRPDLLRSLISYWNNHPSLSYLFSGNFIGPTSQAPRVDEGRRDAVYELNIALGQIPKTGHCPPWLIDRILRNLSMDAHGNMQRTEFCVRKLYAPDSMVDRLGLVEFCGFEMSPHPRMSLMQQLLLRSLVARFWETPYHAELVDWGTSIHDRFLLPHFVERDFTDVIEETCQAGMSFKNEWFAPHYEFRFPKIGEFMQRDIHVELRQAAEPWYVFGGETPNGKTTRIIDSSIERVQVAVKGMAGTRHILTCNGRKLPLHPTGTMGEWVAGVRYRVRQPPLCLHTTLPVDEPLVFDLLDTWHERSVGGCRYHVGHAGGLDFSGFPVNAFEAESRRSARFFANGHTGGIMSKIDEQLNSDFPLTLDLRRGIVN